MIERISRNRRKLLLLAVGWLAVIVPVAIAQSKPLPAPAATPPQVATPVAVPSLSYDVVSVKQNKSGANEMELASPADGDGVTFRNVPLFRIVAYTYRVNRANLIIGMPDWTITERYDVTAKVADSDVAEYHKLTQAQRMLMLQKELADRFKLQVHREPRDMPAYQLIVAKGGLKMKEAKPGDTYPNGVKPRSDTIAHGVTMFITGPAQVTGQGARVEDLAVTLSDYGRQFIGREVVDKTGLTGRYDFTLQWSPDQGAGSISNGADGQRESVLPSWPSIFTAIQEQLGLKMESTSTPAECLIIDHIERPSEN